MCRNILLKTKYGIFTVYLSAVIILLKQVPILSRNLAFTLSNGFTYVEYYLSRGMNIDDFAPNLSFFFSNGMDPEYSVMAGGTTNLGKGNEV